MKDKYIKTLGCLFTILSGISTALLLLLILSLCGGCSKTIYVPVDRVHTVEKIDTLTQYMRDSIFINTHTSGDTVFQVKYVERWQERERIKNVIVHDSIPVAYPVVEYQNRLTDIQKWQIYGFWACLAFIIGIIFVKLRK